MLEKFQAVLGMDADHVMTHLSLGSLYSNMGKPAEAVKHVGRACELEPDDPQNFRFMSVTCRKAYSATMNEMYIQQAEDALHHASVLAQQQM